MLTAEVGELVGAFEGADVGPETGGDVGAFVGAGDGGGVGGKVGFGVGDLVGCQKKIKNNILASKCKIEKFGFFHDSKLFKKTYCCCR